MLVRDQKLVGLFPTRSFWFCIFLVLFEIRYPGIEIGYLVTALPVGSVGQGVLPH